MMLLLHFSFGIYTVSKWEREISVLFLNFLLDVTSSMLGDYLYIIYT